MAMGEASTPVDGERLPSGETGAPPPPPAAAGGAVAHGGTTPSAASHPTRPPRPAGVSVALVPAKMPTNPYPALLARSIEAAGARLAGTDRPGWGWLVRHRGRVDVLHLHWLHVFYRRQSSPARSAVNALIFAKMLLAARLLGYRLVWTMHNAQPHDSPTPLADRIARLAAMNLAEVVIHCEAARPLLRGRKLFGRTHAIPHGSYVGVYPDTVTREEARRRLGIDAGRTAFLAFGLIRGYKGLARLVEAFETLAADPPGAARVTLLVVGQPRDSTDRAVVEELRRGTRADIRWVLEFVPDDEVQLYMRAADFAITAFETILVSGSAILALSFGLPLVAPRLGCLPELVGGGDGRAGILYEPPAGLGGALRAALTADQAALAAAARRRAADLDWGAIGRRHVEVYRGRRPGHREDG